MQKSGQYSAGTERVLCQLSGSCERELPLAPVAVRIGRSGLLQT